MTLGSYRAFYILNWIWRELDITDRKADAVSIIFGILQTAFYIDFAWIYYSRQRVKLRHGGIVDADDLHKGWLLRTVFGHKAVINDEETTPAIGVGNRTNDIPRNGNKWGIRGISVSADEGLSDDEDIREFEDHEDDIDSGGSGQNVDSGNHLNIKDTEELAQILDDDDEGLMSDGNLTNSVKR